MTRRLSLLFFIAYLLLSSVALTGQTKPDRPTFDAKAKYVPGHVLVRFRPHRPASIRASAHAALGSRRIATFRHVAALELVAVAGSRSVPDAVAQYRKNPDVLYAEPDYILHSDDRKPNDTMFDMLWSLQNTGQQNGTAGADIDALKAWDLTTGSSDVVVADIDSGVAYTHPDLAPNLLPGAFFGGDEIWDYVGHGTHTAGTIGAVGDNGQGATGVNWHVSIVPCKFLTLGGGSVSAAVSCLDYIADLKDQGANIIATNNSWGGYFYSQSLYDAIKQHLDRGILFIAAAGNDAMDNDVYPHYPASYDLPNIISVAATDRMDRLASFSNTGRRSVHLAAPGVGVLSTYPAATYEKLDGTSMATPHVTGVAALLKAYMPGLDWRGLKNRLLASGEPLSVLEGTVTHNRLNAYNALTCTDRYVTARVAPRSDSITTVAGAHIPLAMLNINCEKAAGILQVTVEPTGETLNLVDDGTGADQAALDGIYSADYIAPDSGSYTLRFPNGEAVQVRVIKAYKFESVPSTYRNITGTSLELDDESSKPLSLPFPIHIGGQTFDRFFVSSDGFITLDYAFTSGAPFALPYPRLQTIIAPFWDDFAPTFANPRNVYWAVNGTAPNREVVIEWRDLWMYGYEPGDPGSGATFQVVFFEDRDDILFNYKDVDVYQGPWWTTGGGGASVGIQVGSTAGTQYSLGTVSLSNGMSLRWTPAERDLTLSVRNVDETLFLNNGGARLEATVGSLYGLVAPVTLSCTNGAPDVCNSTTVTPTVSGTTANVVADAKTTGEWIFGIRAQAQGLEVSHEQQVKLKVVDFAVQSASPSNISVANGQSVSFTVQLTAAGPFTGSVFLSCTGIEGAVCAFDTVAATPLPGAPATVTVTLTVPPKTFLGDHTLVIRGSCLDAVRELAVPVAITATPDFLLTGGTISAFDQDPTQMDLTVEAQDNYTGNVRLGCTVAPAGPTCTITPGAVSSFPAKAMASIQQANAPAGNYQVTISAEDANRSKSITTQYYIPDYTITGPASILAYQGSQQEFLFSVAWVTKRNKTVKIECSAPAPAYCFAPASVDLGLPSPARVGVIVATYEPIGDFPIKLSILEDGVVMRSITVPVTMKGALLTAGPRREQSVVIGHTSDPIDLTFTPWGGYDLPTDLQLWTCLFCSPQSVTVIPDGQPKVVSFTAIPVADSTWSYGDITFTAIARASIPGENGMVTLNVYAQQPFTIHVKDFSVAFETDRISLAPGTSAAVTVRTSATNGYDYPIQLSCPNDIGPGITCTIEKPTVMPGESTILRLATTVDTLPSVRFIPVTATSIADGVTIVRNASIRTTFGHFSFSVDAPVLTVPNGGEATFFVSYTGPGYGEYSALTSCTSIDPGVTCETGLKPYAPGYIAVSVRTTAGLTSAGPHNVTLTVEAGEERFDIPLTLVMHGPDSLILTSPNGNDLWSSHTRSITWDFTGNPGATVRLELLKNDVFDRVIAENVPLGSDGKGHYDWAIPDSLPFSPWYKVRVVSSTRADISDTSDSRVWIGRGGEIVTPSGGNVYQFGSYYGSLIFYTWSGMSAFTWELYKKDGTFVAKVGDENGSGYFNGPGWTWAAELELPYDLPSGEYKLKMIPKADATRATWNPGGTFWLVRSDLSISSPAKGSNFKPGQTVDIRWQMKDLPPNVEPSDVEITLSPGTNDSILLARSVPTAADGTGVFKWTIPADMKPGLYYRVIVRMYGDPLLSKATEDFSIGTFYDLTVTTEGVGDIDSADRSLFCPGRCTASFAAGSSVTLTATPADNTRLEGWSGACTGTDPVCTIVMNGAKSAGAKFVSTAPGFDLSPSSSDLSVISGSSGTVSFTLKSLNGYSSPVSFSCSNLPLYAQCSFSENNVVPTAEGRGLTVTISTHYATSASSTMKPGFPLGLSIPAFGAVMLLAPKRRKALVFVLLGIMLVTVSVSSCGGGGGGTSGGGFGGGGTPASLDTPKGSYTIVVNASGANAAHSAAVNLVVR